MLFTVKQASIKLNVSMQSIYNKIKLSEFKNKTTKKQGKTYIDEVLLNLIKDTLKVPADDINHFNNVEGNTSNDEVSADTDVKDDYIATLKFQLGIKDEQIKELHKLIENNQVLLKAKPQQDLLQLEEHFQDLDIKLIEIKDKMQKKDQNHKGLFQKIFKK